MIDRSTQTPRADTGDHETHLRFVCVDVRNEALGIATVGYRMEGGVAFDCAPDG